MVSRRTVLAFLIAGLLLLPGPAYAIALESVDSPEPSRLPTGYTAVRINASNDSVLAEGYAGRMAFQVENFQYRHVREEYRAPNRTRAVLVRAIEAGSARVDSEAVAADLRELSRRYPFLTREYETFYEFAVERANGTTRLRTSVANTSELAAAARERFVVQYTALNESEQRVFEKVLEASRGEGYGAYRPWSDEPMVEPGTVVVKHGTAYAVQASLHVDDFSLPDGFFVGLAGSVVGAGSLVVGLVLGAVRWYRRRGDGEAG